MRSHSHLNSHHTHTHTRAHVATHYTVANNMLNAECRSLVGLLARAFIALSSVAHSYQQLASVRMLSQWFRVRRLRIRAMRTRNWSVTFATFIQHFSLCTALSHMQCITHETQRSRATMPRCLCPTLEYAAQHVMYQSVGRIRAHNLQAFCVDRELHHIHSDNVTIFN